jgi:hypothetical protein
MFGALPSPLTPVRAAKCARCQCMKSWCPSSPACASGADFCLGLGVLACKANVGRARRRGSQTSRLRTLPTIATSPRSCAASYSSASRRSIPAGPRLNVPVQREYQKSPDEDGKRNRPTGKISTESGRRWIAFSPMCHGAAGAMATRKQPVGSGVSRRGKSPDCEMA